MSLSQFSLVARSVIELRTWFVDIVNHLCARNYNNGAWSPLITGLSGVPGEVTLPAVSGWLQRWGIECSFTVIISGTHSTASAEIHLPETSVGPGLVVIHSLTDNSFIGTGAIDTVNDVVKLPDYFVENEDVIIKGFYKVRGI